MLAFEAGADLILMPADAGCRHRWSLRRFQQGRLCLERLDESLQRRAHPPWQRIPTSTAPQPSSAKTTIWRGTSWCAAQHHGRRGAGVSTSSGVNLVRVDAMVPSPAALSGWSPALQQPNSLAIGPFVIHGEGSVALERPTGGPLAMDRLGDGAVLLQLFLRGNPFRAVTGMPGNPGPQRSSN